MGGYLNGRYVVERNHTPDEGGEFECIDCSDAVGEYDYCEGDGCGEPLCHDCCHTLHDLALCHTCYEKLLASVETRRPAFTLPADEQHILNGLLRKVA